MDPEDSPLYRTTQNRDGGHDHGFGNFLSIQDGQGFLTHIPPHGGIDFFIDGLRLEAAANSVDPAKGEVSRHVPTIGVKDKGLRLRQRPVKFEGNDGDEAFFAKLEPCIQGASEVIGYDGKLEGGKSHMVFFTLTKKGLSIKEISQFPPSPSYGWVLRRESMGMGPEDFRSSAQGGASFIGGACLEGVGEGNLDLAGNALIG
jgi:hypothetical protein